MNVSIVVPTWRGRHLLEAYLPSIVAASDCYSKTNSAQTEIIVVEDAGGDDTVEWLRSSYPDAVQLLEHKQNEGFCAACQTGFEHARYPIVLLLNNDVRLEQDSIAPMIGHFSDPGIFAVTGKMYNQKGDTFCNGGKIGRFRRGMWSCYQNYDIGPEAAAGPLLSFAAIGAFSAYDREKFLSIGGFDPLTLMHEDIEISYRAWKRGWTILYEPRSIAYHDASQTMKRRYQRKPLDIISRRSRIVMHWILLQDRAMFGQHIASAAGRLLISWMWLDWPYYSAVFTGLKNIAAVRRRRDENRRKMVRSDRELRKMLNDFYRSAPIRIC